MFRKKTVRCALLLLTGFMFVSANAFALDCSKGVELTAKDGTKLCRSKVTLNWWSAMAWCQSPTVGGKLFSLKDCPYNGQDFTATNSCLNLAIDKELSVWTNVPHESLANDARNIYLGNGSIGSSHRANSKLFALCK